jgi:hypothetical protein
VVLAVGAGAALLAFVVASFIPRQKPAGETETVAPVPSEGASEAAEVAAK